MVNKNYSVFGTLTKGYTLVELVIVLAIVAFMGLLTVYGFTNQNKDQRIISSQREIVVNLGWLQTKVDSGVGGSSVKTAVFVNGNNYYTVDGTNVFLTSGVKLSISQTPATIYFSHPAYTSHATACGAASVYFACAGTPLAPYDGTTYTFIKIGFTGSTNRYVRIDGSGMNVNRIYESTN